jgi:hypothetical protein
MIAAHAGRFLRIHATQNPAYRLTRFCFNELRDLDLGFGAPFLHKKGFQNFFYTSHFSIVIAKAIIFGRIPKHVLRR